MYKTVHMMIGAIGTKKSTFAGKLATELDIEILSADQVEIECLSKDEGEIETNIVMQYLDFLDSGNSFIIDGLNLNKKIRNFYIKHAQQRGYELIGYDFGPGDQSSLDRRLNDTRNVSPERWIEIADRNKSEYERPTANEGFKKVIRKVITI